MGITDNEPSDEGPFDLNNDPAIQQDNTDDNETEKSLAGEVEATKSMGAMLGVQLTSQDRLIRESIVKEGLQSVTK